MIVNRIQLGPDTPVVMGILNVTPDSFYNKGRQSAFEEIMKNAGRMVDQGASILDVGGQSTRPSSTVISPGEELARVLPVMKELRKNFPSVILSIDTYWSRVAEECIRAGADMINDISGGELDPGIMDVSATYDKTYICTHMQGTQQTMQLNPVYSDVTKEVINFFEHKINSLTQKGVKNILIDPGFGFGKTLAHNYTLLNDLDLFTSFGKPVLAGLSRKSMVYKPIGSNSEKALNGTTALNMIALQKGTSVLRVHDVREAMECIQLHHILQENKSIRLSQ